MTTSYRLRYGKGNLQASQWDAFYHPTRIRGASKRPVIVLHGAVQNPAAFGVTEVWATTSPNFHKLCHQLAAAGIPVIGGYMGGNAYASDAIAGAGVNDYVNKALAFVAAQTGCAADKANVFGISMGGGTAVRWASLNQSKAAGVAAIIPMASIERVYEDNPLALVAGGASYMAGIAAAWGGITVREVSDAVITNGSPTLTSATAAFTGADVGRYVVRAYNQTGIPEDATILSVQSATSVTLSKNATASGGSQVIAIGDPLPMAGTAGADLIGVHAPRLDAADIPTRIYYATDDPLIRPVDCTDLAAAAGGTAIPITGGHADSAGAVAAAVNGGTDWSDLIDWFIANGS